MKHKLLIAILTLSLLLTPATPAFAAPNPNKNLCKGMDYTVTAITSRGEEVSQTIYLNWQDLYPTRTSMLDTFKNQGDCVSHAARGEMLYVPICPHLLKGMYGGEVFYAIGCIMGRPDPVSSVWISF